MNGDPAESRPDVVRPYAPSPHHGAATGYLVRAMRLAPLVLTDLLTISAVSSAAILGWAVGVLDQSPRMYFDGWPLLGLFCAGFAGAGLYPGFGLGAVEALRRLWLSMSFVFAAIATVGIVLQAGVHLSAAVLFLAWAGLLLILPVARFVVLAQLRKTSWWCEPVVVVGTGKIAKRTIRSLRGSVSLGYRPVVVLSSRPHRTAVLEGLPVLPIESSAHGCRVALVAVEDWRQSTRLAKELGPQFERVVLVRSGVELPVEGTRTRNLGGMLGLELHNPLLLRRNRVIKRCLDVVLGGVALALSAPIIVLGALLVALRSSGPVLFYQEREGLGGRPIKVWKLRTMFPDAEARLDELLAADRDAHREWTRRFKLRADPRVVPGIGGLLRRFSIDELPQLWNVLTGDMSLVGPRPLPRYHLDHLSSEFRALRSRTRCGVTGLWQVNVRSLGDVEDQELLDTYYIRNWSVWLDLYIMARTAGAVWFGHGAY